MSSIKNIQREQGKSRSELRKYGLIMFAAFAVISILLYLKGETAYRFTAVPSVLFLLFAAVLPSALAPVEKYWMKLAAVLGFVVTNILLTLVFVLAILPVGLLLQVFGKSPLRKGFKKSARLSSYWLDVNSDGPSRRPDKPY